MTYKLFDSQGKEVNHHDLQDKAPWCKTGATFEEVFINKHGADLNLIINPEKKTNPYAPDLYNTNKKCLADLKTQNTPFFQAASRYNINPQFAVTFNVKDFKRYSKLYPEIEIYFWVDWIATTFEGNSGRTSVKPMIGVWFITFSNIIELTKTSPVHSYQQRKYDTKGNAKDSFVFNLSNPLFTKIS